MHFRFVNLSRIVLVLITTLVTMSYLTFEDEIPDFVGPRFNLSEPSPVIISDDKELIQLQNMLIKSNTTRVSINSIRGFPLPFYGVENSASSEKQVSGMVQIYSRGYFLPFGFVVTLFFWNSIYSLVWLVLKKKSKKKVLIHHLR